MEKKYSQKTQVTIERFLENVKIWRNLFAISISYYVEGWAAYLREKNMFPRSIVIFKPYESDYFSIKSFEVSIDEKSNEIFTELYSKENIYNMENLILELKEIIYGKDLIDTIKKG